jgi:hypothetical protein
MQFILTKFKESFSFNRSRKYKFCQVGRVLEIKFYAYSKLFIIRNLIGNKQ